jgi:hypothetical protein
MTDLLALLDQAIDELAPADSSRCSRLQAQTRTPTGTGKALKEKMVPAAPVVPVPKREIYGEIAQTPRTEHGERSIGPQVARASFLQNAMGKTSAIPSFFPTLFQ